MFHKVKVKVKNIFLKRHKIVGLSYRLRHGVAGYTLEMLLVSESDSEKMCLQSSVKKTGRLFAARTSTGSLVQMFGIHPTVSHAENAAAVYSSSPEVVVRSVVTLRAGKLAGDELMKIMSVGMLNVFCTPRSPA